MPDRKYIEELARYQIKVLNRVKSDKVPNEMTEKEYADLKTESKKRVVINIESYSRLTYMTIEQGEIKIVDLKNAGNARRIIKQIVFSIFE